MRFVLTVAFVALRTWLLVATYQGSCGALVASVIWLVAGEWRLLARVQRVQREVALGAVSDETRAHYIPDDDVY